MILLAATDIRKVYGEKVIFNQLSLSIHSEDKIGLIGINGTGKSSLLKILAGFETADGGDLVTSNELMIEYLPQNPYFEEDATVIEQIFKGTSRFMQVLKNYEETSVALEKDPDNTKLQEKLLSLTTEMDAVDAWQAESEAKAILTKLGITDFNQKVGNLSGGQKKRIALAGALIRPCNLLIMDEPTNHLDNDTIDYLEEILKNKKCAVLMVTHDRYFLDRVTNKIAELEDGKLYTYDGNYGKYLEISAERAIMQQRLEEKQKTLYKQELEWMRKGVEARRTKQKARQDRFHELKDNMQFKQADKMDIGLATSRLGKKVIEMENVSKAFGDRILIRDFTYNFIKGERIGIIGNNGLGKSTLLNLITGELTPDSGVIEIGETVRIGYYSQESKDMDDSMRVIDYVKERGEYVRSEDGSLVSASKMLERFLFPSHMQYTPIGKLSGGERRRLYLLGVLMNDVNVLLLDEPTNDLDIQTLQILEDYIEHFNGPVIAVSHDRYFLDRISDKLFVFEGNGVIRDSVGGYSDYIAYRKEEVKEANSSIQESKAKADTWKKNTQTKLKMSYNEKKEFESIDSDIENLELKLEALEAEMVKEASNYSRLGELMAEKENVELALEEKMARWEYLNELDEKIKNQ
ncbi:ABC-F family ATP-binding cassette domain-containing protein [Niameybacter massiliensis]|uniref:ABC-F family ATP-binding cassette domain-containing protein n=1 Tax=Holtiella tumoricola TaxID=3018743 RepID=A0AA42DL64_9FIRM|nr:ABC-F family ATP-binding cassette domain-containing protein [Holtiella tumoricola]MDA3730678.1 ABC-F family ATP-binding cassette domain-containing protein [Holtiella tumoricola]